MEALIVIALIVFLGWRIWPQVGAAVGIESDNTPLQPFGRTLQTSVTFPTTVGTTYWVQIGGINESVFGDDTNVPYGNLRVRVR